MAGLIFPAPVSASTAAAAQDTVVQQPFAADSGDACPHGRTKGLLGWHLPPLGGGPVVADVTGILVDQPVSGDVSTPECADDFRFSTVTFTAIAGARVVDTESARVDNGTVRFAFRLAAVTATPIDLVVVQVCRVNLDPAPFTFCGPKQQYRAPIAIS
ncbi:hypothetical protein [Virgisporangium aurantiacum]|uniref:hypothetical protein n=1 Tax=Virgisporangium aurantiacum TaxID=175570 RepID=UPI001951567F|nr:hypothetical protein [Virgisporangium aurantiacum]